MNEIIEEHDRLKENLQGKTKNLESHLIMKEINDWEEKSIAAIRQVATESRNQLHNAVDRLKSEYRELLEPLTQELEKCYRNTTFIETDLNIWTKKLEKIKTELISPRTISVKKDYYDLPFITKILIIETPDDIFQNPVGKIKIDETGKIIKHSFWNSYGTVRSRGEYSTGCYQFHFQIEDFDKDFFNGFFFGIISKTMSIKKGTPPAYTSCGWTGCLVTSSTYSLVGIKHENGLKNIEKHDTFELLINCDQRKLRLINKRTDETDQITIDLDEHPFPWQLSFSLYHSGQRVRLL